MDRLDEMRAFAMVAERGGFADAARHLRLAPSGVTRAVAALEARLGVTLLARTTRSVRLTELGARYLESCKRLLADITDADRQISGEQAQPLGTLVVAAPLLFGRLHVLPVIADLLRAHPALSVRLLLSDRQAHLVEDGIDVAVRIGELADSRLRASRIAEVRRVLAASPAYLVEHGVPVAPTDLAHHRIIAFDGLEATNDWFFGGSAPIAVRINPRLVVSGADAAIAAAEAGLGITRVLSYQVAAAIADGRLCGVLDGFAPPSVPVQIVYPAHRAGSANLAVFLAAMRAGR